PCACFSISASRTLIQTISLSAIARTISAYAGSTVSNRPGQLSSLCGQDNQVPRCGSHSAGHRNFVGEDVFIAGLSAKPHGESIEPLRPPSHAFRTDVTCF